MLDRISIASIKSRNVVLFAGIALVWGLFTWWTALDADREMRDELHRIALLVLHTLDAEKIESLRFERDDRRLQPFQQIESHMREVTQTIQQSWSLTSQYISIYTMKMDNGVIRFGPESIPVDDPRASPPGTVYIEPPHELLDTFSTGTACIVGPFSDEYGTFVSAFIPLQPAEAGPSETIIGMDIMADNWKIGVLKKTAPPSLLVLALLTALVMGFSFARSRIALSESEEKYRVIVEKAHDGIMIVQDGVFSLANGSMARMLGVPHGTLEGRRFTDFVWPDDREMVMDHYWRRISGETIRSEYEFRISGPGGVPVWVQLTATLINWNGRPATIAIISDISDRKQAEQKLEYQHSILNERLKISKDLHLLSLDELIQRTLDVAERLTGSSISFYHFIEADQKTITLQMWSENTLKNMCTAEGKGDHYPVEKAGIWAQCIQTREVVVVNDYNSAPGRRGLPHGHADVTRFISIPVIRDGMIKSIIGLGNKRENYTLHDVYILSELAEWIWNSVEQKRAGKELLDERQRLASIIRGTNVGTWEWNVQTGETVFNERWAAIIGYTLEELSPVSIQTWERFAHPDDLAASEELLSKHFSGETDYYEFESRMRHKDGSWIWVLDRGKVSTWTDDGKPLLMQGTHQDITRRKKDEEMLRETEEFRKRIFESSHIPIVVMDAITFRYIDCNPAALEAYRFRSKEDTLGKTPLDVSAPLQYDGTPSAEKAARYIQMAKDRGSLVFEWRHCRPDGEIWDAEVHLLSFTAGERQLMQFSLVDITERKRAEDALRESEKRFRSLFEESPVSIIIHDRDSGEIIDANPRACASYGLSSVDELKSYNIWMEPPYSDEDALAWIRRAAQEGPQQFEWHSRKSTGEEFWEEVSLNSLVIDGVERILATSVDISGRKTAEEELYRVSIHDPLTGVFNRGYIINRLESLISEYQRDGRDFSLSIFDLDFFKAVNDTHGHLAGDFMLQQFAEILASCFRTYDLVGRYGGEEFIVIAENIDKNQTGNRINGMLEKIRRHVFDYNGIRLSITFSAGIVNSSEIGADMTVEKLIDRADSRLYRAKEQGRNRVVCE